MKDKIKILHFAPGFLFGGIESRLLDWYNEMDRSKIQFDLLKQSNNSDDTTNVRQFRKLGGNLYNIPPFSAKNLLSYIKCVDRFFKSNNQYEVVHSHSLTTGLFVLYFAKRYGIKKRILHARTTKTDGGFVKKSINNLLKYLAKRYATDYFACSSDAGIWGFGQNNVKRGKVLVIKNGIYLDKFKFNREARDKIRSELNITSRFVIGNICRLTTAKNIPFMIDVFANILKESKESVLLIVGDGPIRELINKQIENLGISESVIMVGKQDNIWDYYSAMDLFFSPSLWEGFGTTLLEAQVSGLPSIGSTGYPNEVKVFNSCTLIDLNTPLEYWAKQILLKINNSSRSEVDLSLLKERGYDVRLVAHFLQSIYVDK